MNKNFPHRAAIGCLWFTAFVSSPLSAQCIAELRGPIVPGVDSAVQRLAAWDPDGSGPAPVQIVCTGGFRGAGSTVASSIALFDPVTSRFTALASFVDGTVDDVLVMPNNDLVVAGNFTRIDAVASRGIARFDGASWSGLAGGVGGNVSALALLPNGDIAVGGSFQQAGGLPASNLASWNGSAWSTILGGVDGPVFALQVRFNGSLVVGGRFQTAFLGASTFPVSNVAIRLGFAPGWSDMGGGVGTFTGPSLSSVSSIVEVGSALVVGGSFALAGATGGVGGVVADNIAYFNSGLAVGGWAAPAIGTSGPVARLRVAGVNSVIVTGTFATAGGLPVGGIASHSIGGPFTAFGTGVGGNGYTVVNDALQFGADLFVGGTFDQAGSVQVADIARFRAGAWTAVVAGGGLHGLPAWPGVMPPSQVTALFAHRGETIVGGRFASAGGVALNGIAAWDGTSFARLDRGFDGQVFALGALPNGNLFAGGAFTSAGGIPATGAAQWNGSFWQDVAGGVNGTIRAAIRLSNGDLLAGGSFSTAGGSPADNVARFDGTTWRPLASGLVGTVHALAELPNGDIVAGGSLVVAGSGVAHLAVFRAGVWRALGGGTDQPVHALLLRANGDLLVGGQFQIAGGVAAGGLARWDGMALSSFANTDGVVYSLATTTSGNLVVGGVFGNVGGQRARNLAVIDAQGVVTAPAQTDGAVRALHSTGPESMAAGGDFAVVGSSVAPRFVELASLCRANSSQVGAGCAGTTLSILTLPQIGTTMQSLVQGMPSLAIAVMIVGSSQVSLPLPAVLPQGLAGCFLHASPDVLGSQLVVGGSAQLGLPIPSNPSFVGANWLFQVAALELDASLAIVQATSTEAFVLRIGSF